MTLSRLEQEILALKRERQAVILAHNYQRGEVQDIADFVGDSLGLSRQAAQTDAKVIVFCGVHFMAETAKIICPDKVVLEPDVNAGCPLANMLAERELKALKDKHPGARVVCYVNSSAGIKAMSDICCTSANAARVVSSFPPEQEVIFVPDRNLGRYTGELLGRELILHPGYCPTHVRILPENVRRQKELHPRAKVTVHPECTREVIDLADHVGSTSQILKFCSDSDAREFIIGTEVGILHRLRKENPNKVFHPASELADCPNMKLNTLEKILWSLEDLVYQVTVPDEVADQARASIERMLQLS